MQTGSNTYNIDNIDKRDNKVFPSIGYEAYASEEEHLAHSQQMSREGLLDPGPRVPDSRFNSDEVKSAIAQFIDNGEQARQRYKVKLRINLYPQGDVEFIGSVNKRIQDFYRHIPGNNKQAIIDLAKNIRNDVKRQHGVYPYIGKFHRKATKAINIEPDTFVAVWYNYEDEGWEGVLKFQDWETHFYLFQDRLTAKQKEIGVKGQWVYKNPKYDKTERPLTFAQMRQLGLI